MSVEGEKGKRSEHRTAEKFEVIEPMNAHGTVTVRARNRPATYHVVEYGSERVRSRLGDLPAEATVRLELTRAGCRANVWRATRVLPGRPAARR